MALTTKINKLWVEEVLTMYPSDPETKPVKLPLTDPHQALNGQYFIEPVDVSDFAYFLGRINFEATSISISATSISLQINPTTFHWAAGVLAFGVSKFNIYQTLPTVVTPFLVARIDLGSGILFDGDADVDLTNNGFITFDSTNYI